ncbi:B3/B4 domain-containing protein [Lacticigenium naphthae]|uniref:B3/B4 domain-containing protein n=1 Tax=Lacticigenium naphthae TaxID=515351 RepID=UPI00040378A1|nr:phenylalanine--tRNA ligase beta subunit-related protein [Lacticigenium naphthae]
MKKISIDQSFWEVFPEAHIYVLEVFGISNKEDNTDLNREELLNKAKEEAKKHVQEEPFSSNKIIAEWREAFREFKTKKGARSSIEALLKRAAQDHTFSPINPLVDIYNSVSLKYGVPCGGEDVSEIQGDLKLGKAIGGEAFKPLGADKDAPALPGEIIYYDEEGAVCRCLNWREAQRTMLTEETKDAVMFLEAIKATQYEQTELAANELKHLIDQYFQIESRLHCLTKEQPAIHIP